MRAESISMAILLLILGIASAAWATPYFEVDEADRKDYYQPSDWITINIAIEDYVPFEDEVIGLMVDAISDYGAGGIAAEPQVFNPDLNAQYPGILNSNGMLVEFMLGVDTNVPAIGAAGILYSFEYHVPVVPASTIIEIGTYSDVYYPYFLPEIDYLDGTHEEGHLIPVNIHIVPEPSTLFLLGLGAVTLRKKRC